MKTAAKRPFLAAFPQVIWEADTPDFHRRKRAARACANCQKRKKRCHHTFDHAGTIESEGVSETLPEGINSVPLTSHAADVVRFVGDMNPESILTDLSSRPKGAPRPSVLGIWLQPNEDEDQEPRGRPDERQQDSSRTPRSPIQSPNKTTPRLSALQERYLHELGAFRVLPQQTQEALVSLYFSCIDVVIPLFDDGVFLEKFRQGSASNILINAMCMVAAKIEDAVDFLRLVESDPVLSPMAFARILYVGVEAAMKANLETDRVAKIQILTLLSLHNDGPGGIEESSIHLTQAIHHAHTIGLQVLCAEQRLEAHPRLLYWTLWSLDKLNAAIAGRPVTIADRDIAIARPVLEDEPMFQVFIMFLTLSDLLAQTIAFYRPNVSQSAPGWEEDFPRFEEIVDQNIFRNLQRSHQHILEVYYHAIAVLACRAGDYTTVSYQRRASAATKIYNIASIPDQLGMLPLPLVPYALSLSVTAAYRQLRDARSPADRREGQTALARRVKVLEQLTSRWSSAAAMTKLGHKALRNLEKPGAEDANRLSHVMENEISPCKFLPNVPRDSGIDMNVLEQSGLDVLSSAAEAHAQTAEQGGVSSTQSTEGFDYRDTVAHAEFSDTLDPRMQDSKGFQDLDTLFGDFVDLSMPTFFQDPLFENECLFDLPEL